MGFRSAPEIRNPMTGFLDRLRLLGANDREVEDIVAMFDESDVSDDDRKLVMTAPDARIVELIRAMRVEDADPGEAFAAAAADDTETDDERADRERRARADAVAAFEFDKGTEFTLDQLTAWVGDDAARAAVAHEAELAREDGGRKGAAELFERFDATPL